MSEASASAPPLPMAGATGTPTRNAALKIVATVLVVVSAVGALIYFSLDASAAYYMHVDEDDLDKRGGLDALINEIQKNGTAVDKECLAYVLYEEAGSSDATFQSGLRRDCDAQGKLLAERTVRDTQGGGVRGMRLADFVASPVAEMCQLKPVHVAVLRLYTTAMFKAINDPLRDQARFDRGEPHPLPLLVAFLKDALGRLREVESTSPDANETVILYRGMRDVTVQMQHHRLRARAELLAREQVEDKGMSLLELYRVCMLCAVKCRHVSEEHRCVVDGI